MPLSSAAVLVMQGVVGQQNQQYKVNYANALQTYITVTEQNWIQDNVQARNMAKNVNFTPTAIPAPPQLQVATLNTDTGEIDTTLAPVDPSIQAPVLPPYIDGSSTNGFASLQPNLTSQEEDLNTSTSQQILVLLQKVASVFGIK